MKLFFLLPNLYQNQVCKSYFRDKVLGESFTAENTKHWAIQKMQLLLPYTRATIGQMFATGCIQLDSANQQRTLMIGLGGAAIPNFLAELGGNASAFWLLTNKILFSMKLCRLNWSRPLSKL